MPVVSNTSPILNLAIVGKLALLQEQFVEVLIPKAVLDELRIEEDLPGSNDIRNAISVGWLKVKKVFDKSKVRILSFELDKGESEAIALALQVKADWILVDEREARRICRQLGLRVTGVLGIILKAWKNGKISSLEDILKELINKAGFRVSNELYQSILKESRGKGN